MSLLAPLYFLGALAVGLPILFHLIRRRPKGEVEFSSLMFLQPSPPRLTRRSRLENLPLLLIRALALIMLAAAFARPFLRQSEQSDTDAVGRRIVIAVDTSASMRRADLWKQAKMRAADVIQDIGPADQLSLVCFDQRPTTLLNFDESDQLTPGQLQATAIARLDEQSPTWFASDLGRAISYAADLAVTHEAEDKTEDVTGDSVAKTRSGSAHLVVITDMQAGSDMESLQVYAWPDNLNLDVRRVATPKTSNAWATLMQAGNAADSEGSDDRVRVRVSNTSDAETTELRLAWKTSDGLVVTDSEMPVQVPPGESRVVPMSSPVPGVTMLSVLDDDHDFDNQTFVTTREPVQQSLMYVGRDADESLSIAPKDSLLYYLKRVPLSDRFREVSVEAVTKTWPKSLVAKDTPLVVLARAVTKPQARQLSRYVEGGGRLLIVLESEKESGELMESVREIAGGNTLAVDEADVKDYVMLSQIKFGDPVFASMSDPQFNDFTKVRFWDHRSMRNVPESWNVLARFDDGDPALLDVPVDGTGKMWVLATGWQPESSQLALSTKFIPMVFAWFKSSSDSGRSLSHTLGQPIDLPSSPTAKITGPDGAIWGLANKDESTQIDQPGVYKFADGNQTFTFAVNMPESESRTETLDDDVLERFGIKLGASPTSDQLTDSGRQLRDIELEGRQKLWQWLLVGGLAMLLLESWIGGRLSRSTVAA